MSETFRGTLKPSFYRFGARVVEAMKQLYLWILVFGRGAFTMADGARHCQSVLIHY